MSFLSIISSLLGWIYTLLWSLSFYPQAILMHRRKSVAGFSLDFAHLNFIGFLNYSLFNLSFLLSSTVQQQYKDRHHGSPNVVRWNDAVFALHALALTAFQVGQVWWYPRERGQRISKFARVSMAGIALVVLGAVLLVLPDGGRTKGGEQSPSSKGGGSSFSLQYLDLVNLFSYIKLYITLVKYLPQVLLNRQRKSTKGFSIEAILLDFAGGVLSLLQLVIDAGLIQHEWSGVTGDFGKL